MSESVRFLTGGGKAPRPAPARCLAPAGARVLDFLRPGARGLSCCAWWCSCSRCLRPELLRLVVLLRPVPAARAAALGDG